MTEPELLTLPTFSVVGLRVRARAGETELGSLWRRLGEIASGRVAYGVTFDFDPATREFSYLAGYPVDPAKAYPQELDIVQVPAQRYAVFSTTLPDLMQTIQHANHVWLPGSSFEHAGGPELERYDEAFDPTDPGSRMSFCIPVVPRHPPSGPRSEA